MAQIDTWLSTVNRNNTKKIQGKKKKDQNWFAESLHKRSAKGSFAERLGLAVGISGGFAERLFPALDNADGVRVWKHGPLNFTERPVLPRVAPSAKKSSPRAFQYRAADARRTRTLPRAWLHRRPLSAKEHFADSPISCPRRRSGARRLYCFR